MEQKTGNENNPSQERIEDVRRIVEGLLAVVNAGGLKEVESAQPDELRQFEAEDAQGNNVCYIFDSARHYAHPIEIRNKQGRLVAQSWDNENWSVDRYIENGTDIQVAQLLNETGKRDVLRPISDLVPFDETADYKSRGKGDPNLN